MPQRYASGNIVKRGDASQLKASGAETTNTTSGTVTTSDGAGTVYVEVNVTAASGTTPTLMVVVEGSNDLTNWFTLGVIGSNGFSVGSVATAVANFTTSGGPIRGAFSAMQFVRTRSVITGTTPSFTYSINVEVL
jgi:hypothetical protein